MTEDKKKITAAILTLSESIEGLYKIMRKDLQFRAEQEQSKIVEDFLPKRMRPTTERFEEFQKLLEEIEASELERISVSEPEIENKPKVEKVKYESESDYEPKPALKLNRDETNPPETYTFSE